MDKIRTVHYLNQFFGQIGGESEAGIPPRIIDGVVGVGAQLQKSFDETIEIVHTIVCGDNYAAENLSSLEDLTIDLIGRNEARFFIAGPSFAAGRYGMACGHLTQAVLKRCGIPVLAAMNPISPGVEMAKRDVYILETGNSSADMKNTLIGMSRLGKKLLLGEKIGLPAEEGYIPRGIRINVRMPERGSKRAVNMLVKKLRSEPFETELPMPVFDRVPPPPCIKDLTKAVIAIGTEGGIVPKGNPDRIEAHNASKLRCYPLADMTELLSGEYEVAHGGYDPVAANANPNRVLPLDVARVCQKEAAFAELYGSYPVTVGNVTAVRSAEKYGREIGEMLKADGVDGIILTSTWGTGTRCGATLAREIDRVGIPAVLITAVPPIALTVGANRIVRGVAIPTPIGKPDEEPEEEFSLRKRIFDLALQALTADIKEQHVFERQ